MDNVKKNSSLDNLLKLNIDKINIIDLISIISKMSDEDKSKTFENEEIKKRLREGILEYGKELCDQYRAYREVMHYLTSSEVLSLYDAYYLRKFFSNTKENGNEYIFFVCLCEKNINETVKIVLKDDKLFHEFYKNNDYFYSIFYNLEYELLRDSIFKMEESNYSYRFDFVSSCSPENQKKLLSENLKKDTIIRLLSNLKVEVLSDFFQNDKRAKDYISNVNVVSYAKAGVVFNDEIVGKKEFFERLKSSSFVTFRNNINIIERHNNPIIIEKRLREYYDELLSSYNPYTKIFNEYSTIINNPRIRIHDVNDFILSDDIIISVREILKNDYSQENKQEIIELLRNITNKKITEIVVDALFQDNYYNVCLNIKEMLRFNEKLSDNQKVLDKEKIEFYQMVLDFDDISCEKKIELYKELKDKNVNLVFYEDLRLLKDLSYDKIKDDMLKIKEHSDYLNCDISKKYNVDVYDLRDKQYVLLVRHMRRFYPDSSYESNCYSLISDENNETYGSDHGFGFLYGFDKFDNDTVLHVLETDAYSSSLKEESSKYVNRIMTAREIVNSDDWYSEIQIVNRKSKDSKYKYDALRPSYIICYNEINEEVVEEAKRLRIPIVLLKRKILSKGNETDIKFDMDTDLYIDNTISEYTIKRKR